jgi:hypothetical protein
VAVFLQSLKNLKSFAKQKMSKEMVNIVKEKNDPSMMCMVFFAFYSYVMRMF